MRLVGVGANRPILLAFKCAKTVSIAGSVGADNTGIHASREESCDLPDLDSYSSGVSSNLSTADKSVYSPGRAFGSVLSI